MEYSLSDPPAVNGSLIDNALSIAQAPGRVWFTEWTANYVGFVSTQYNPAFSLSVSKTSLVLSPGQAETVTVRLSGEYHGSLGIQLSDSESFSSVPKNITMTADTENLQSLQGSKTIDVTVAAGKALAPGDYRLLITVDGGLVRESAYVTLHVVG
jgi:hypothetical protein